MIIIIRALPQWGKDDGDYDSPTSRDETPAMREKKKGKKKEKEKKREKGHASSTLVLHSSTMFLIWRVSYASLSYN